jgi:hypothetical protein
MCDMNMEIAFESPPTQLTVNHNLAAESRCACGCLADVTLLAAAVANQPNALHRRKTSAADADAGHAACEHASVALPRCTLVNLVGTVSPFRAIQNPVMNQGLLNPPPAVGANKLKLTVEERAALRKRRMKSRCTYVHMHARTHVCMYTQV